MLSIIKSWFVNQKKPEEGLSIGVVERHEANKHYYNFVGDMQYYYKNGLELAKAEIVDYKEALANALTERKTCTHTDFGVQLGILLKAYKAVVHQEFLGVQANSEMSRILNRNLQQEIGKLKFLVFENLDMTPEEAEIIIEGYIKKESTNESI